MSDTVKMFDYWAFHKDGRVQFIQVCQGEVIDYQEYDCVEDAPIALLDERTLSTQGEGGSILKGLLMRILRKRKNSEP